MFEEFLATYCRRLIDSDGNPEVLVPQLLDVGVNIPWPVEVAEGMEAPSRCGNFGHDLIMWGEIDKREIAKGK